MRGGDDYAGYADDNTREGYDPSRKAAERNCLSRRLTTLIFTDMTKMQKESLRSVMTLAWQFVRKNGFSLSEALKMAWKNAKLHAAMQAGIVRFYFRKVDGSIREAFGTLKQSMIPVISGARRMNATCQVYFDTEKGEWRCYKKANLVTI